MDVSCIGLAPSTSASQISLDPDFEDVKTTRLPSGERSYFPPRRRDDADRRVDASAGGGALGTHLLPYRQKRFLTPGVDLD